MARNRLIIIEGPNGVGKTTLANFLRENYANTNLFRLSSQKEKQITGKLASVKMYEALFRYLKEMEEIKIDFIFDRFFFSEEVYAKAGFKEYLFTDAYLNLLEHLQQLNYEVYIFILGLKDLSLYEGRLKRKNHAMTNLITPQKAIALQEEYFQLAVSLQDKKFHVATIYMDDANQAYQEIEESLKGEEE